MARNIRITVPEEVAAWLEARAIEVTPSELATNAIIEYYEIGLRETKKYGSTEDAKQLIKDVISKRGEAKAEDVQKIAELTGISRATLRRAKTLLGVRSYKQGFGSDSKWYWTLQ